MSFHLPQGGGVGTGGPLRRRQDHHRPADPALFRCAGRAVLWGGRDVRSIPTAELMEQISFRSGGEALQKSIRDNIRAARPDATEAEILHAAQLAQCGDILEKDAGRAGRRDRRQGRVPLRR